MNKKDRFSVIIQNFPSILWLVVVLSIAAYLRFYNLSTNPGWYSDEGTLVNIAQNLIEGRNQYLAINKSTLLAARLPLYPAILGCLFAVFEPSITTIRYLSASLGVVTVGVLYWSVLKIYGKEKLFLAVTASFFLTIYPPAILYSRIGLSYNLLAPLIVLIFLFMWKYIDTGDIKNLLFASLLIGVGSISDLMIFTLAPAILLISFYKKRMEVIPAFGLIILPFLIYSVMMISNQKEAFLYDFTFTFFRLGEIPIIAQFPSIILNYASLIIKDYWWTLAITGMFLLPTSRTKYLVLLLFLTPVFMLGRTTALSGLGFYYLSPLYPLLALGAASFITEGLPYVLNIIKNGLEKYADSLAIGVVSYSIMNSLIFLMTSMILFMIILAPFVFTLFYDGYQLNTIIKSEISPVLVNTSDAHSVLSYINTKAEQEDLVLASPAIAWAVNADAADFQMALAYEGKDTRHFPNDIPADRFSFNPEYKRASYVIIDPIWTNWAVPNMTEVEKMVEAITDWPLVFSSGEIHVYQNPYK